MKKQPLIYYGWIIVAAGIVSYALGYGSRYSFSVIFPSLLKEFQWPRDLTAGILSIHFLAYGLAAPVVGSLVDRIGPRKTMALGTILLSLGLALSGLGNKPWHFFLSFGVATGIGLSLTGAVPFTAVLRNWFERKRGLAFSILFFGVGGSFIFYPGIAFLIDNFDWRNTFLIEAVIIMGCMLPLIIFIVRYHPRDKGLLVDGTSEDKNPYRDREMEVPLIRDQTWVTIDWTLSKAVKTRPFWMLSLATFCLWGLTQHIVVAHHIAFAMDMGYSRIYASSVLSLFGVFFSLGCLIAFISDRIGRESTLTMGAIFIISGILMLMFIKDNTQPWMLYYYAAAVGFGTGMTTPPIAAATTDIFQGPKVGAIIGFVWFSFAVGGALGPWLAGWIFELTKSYKSAFILAIAICALGCGGMWWAAPRKIRQVPGRLMFRKDGKI